MNNKVIPITDPETIAPSDMDSFNSGTIMKTNEVSSRDGNGGGSNMDKYATKEELKHTKEFLSEKIDHRSDVIEEKILGVKSQIESSNKLLYWILGIFGAVFTGLLVALLTNK